MSNAVDAKVKKQERVPTFKEAVYAAYFNEDFMREYRRLSGSTLGTDKRLPLERMIDDSTGFDPHEKEWTPFLDFVRDYIWTPVAVQNMADTADTPKEEK